MAQAAEKIYNSRVATQLHMRPHAGMLRFFDGFDLLDSGLVVMPLWRPDSPAEAPADPAQFLGYAGRRPQALSRGEAPACG